MANVSVVQFGENGPTRAQVAFILRLAADNIESACALIEEELEEFGLYETDVGRGRENARNMRTMAELVERLGVSE